MGLSSFSCTIQRKWPFMLSGLSLLLVVSCQKGGSSVSVDASPKMKSEIKAASGGGDTGDVGDVEILGMNLFAAKPGDVVDVTGKNLRTGMTVTLKGSEAGLLASGVEVALVVKSDTQATFIMPSGVGVGLVEVNFALGGQAVKATTASLVSDSSDDLPVMIVDATLVCDDLSFYNAKGEVKKGKRNCSVVALENCSRDGQTNCKSNDDFKVAAVTGLASKVVNGQTVAGVAGGVTVTSYANCSSDGETGCVTTSAYKAAKLANFSASDIRTGVTVAGVDGSLTGAPANCAANGEQNCVVAGSFKALDPSAVDASKMLTTQTLLGVTGTLSSCNSAGAQGCYATGTYYAATACASNGSQSCYATGSYKAATACASDGGSNCFVPTYAATTQPYKAVNFDNIDATKIRSSATIAGQAGSLADCSTDGGTNCVAVTNFPAVDKANSLTANVSKIRSSVTIAGVSGSLSDCASAGSQSCYATGSYYAATSCASNGSQSCYATGTYKAATACGSDGASNCYVATYAASTQPYKSIDFDNIDLAKVRTSQSIAGSAGTLADCSGNASTGCVTTSSYKSADLTNLTAGNIKRGVAIAGVTGAFPSSTYTLPRYSDSGSTTNTSSDSVTTSFTNFITQMTSAGSFEFWDSTGIRHTGSGDADITNANVASGVQFENLSITGTASGGGGSTPDAWDLRAGVTVGSVTGKLKTNCRNGGNTALWDMTMPQAVTVDSTTEKLTSSTAHGLATGDAVRVQYTTAPDGLSNATTYYAINVDSTNIKLATSSANATGGTAIDITSNGAAVVVFKWGDGTLNTADTIDDYNNGGAVLSAHPWSSSNYFCGGVEASSGDANVWKDTTKAADGSASDCATTTANCTYKDKISGLEWTKTKSTGTSWGAAMDLCNTTTHNTVTGWRLPTQKELMDAYNHGIYSAANANWITSANMAQYFWSSSTVATNSSSAWYVQLAYGLTNGYTKTGGLYVACVRP